MKWIILTIGLLTSIIRVEAQSAIIVLTNGPTYIIVTNVFPVTVVNAPSDKTLKPLQIANIIDPTQGQYLGAFLTTNTSFVIGSFPTNYFQIAFYYENPNNFKLDFTSVIPIKWMNGLPPTTNSSGCIVFENVFGRLRATQ